MFSSFLKTIKKMPWPVTTRLAMPLGAQSANKMLNINYNYYFEGSMIFKV